VKLVFMTYYVGMNRDVLELLDKCGVMSYTHWDEVTGRLSCGEPREGTDVWPGFNAAIQAVLREETAERLTAAIQEYNASQRGDERIDACFLEVQSAIRAADEFDTCGQ
jgi:hypothetical protein